ncbi:MULTISPECIES: flagellar basal body-associated FliL family protein [Idiomarina]|jgi:flagellar FliL protein|uniref:Flagellar protein FliL n=2 Tax=Idiomarina baltica TaxID=190892 RepID=A0A348WQV6_9GAMM|nr:MULTISPECIES: flagellar basal body-associated FliL family protein [Idiomarina]MAF75408.1 flagellar basal body-associated protein FliL [Idiomarinaceae bacterium]MEC8924613.1 flagellar basal body-associated FliL family protein [Pseudomonadota bacterium]EAQ33132.1 flagellar basal body-associated protein [Idiomarina baltica OS145]KXS34922.1 MAG: flagellar basal body-associated protein FliL-like protein [Idiomarina sp. T82-3]MBR37454.1 flagellar basal body-associated protein FliL [Idiomarina sp.|tara:strand:- start:2460 stop:2867 length:408 start_codon:yes stop_codon:yes gene_type:complete
MTLQRWLFSILLLFSLTLFSASAARAQDVAYYGFEPDIITNFIKDKEEYRLGFIRVAVEVMVDNPQNVSVVEHHAPLLRDAFIQILSTASEQQIRTMTGRDQLRLKCFEQAQRLMAKETGSTVIKQVIFTKYIYQ